ncbi:MAG: hypothetical protein NVS1B14_06490 [Vulcanimicrobiaceae bacterium]
MRVPLAAFSVASLLVLCVFFGEYVRLVSAVHGEARAQDAFVRSRWSLERLRVRYRSLRTLAHTASEVQAVRTSGLREAIRLADVARRIPQGVAVTSLRHSAGAVTVGGSAVDQQALARALESLSASNRFSGASLIDAVRDGRSENWRYELRLTDAANE